MEFTPLDAAINNDDIALVKLLLQNGASTRDAHAESPILYVKSVEVAKLLLKHGADIHTSVKLGKRQGNDALNFACRSNKPDLVAFLIAHGIDVNSTGAIMNAAVYDGLETLRLLLKHGAKVGPNSPGADALYWATATRQFESAKLLLQYGAAANPRLAFHYSYIEYPLGEAAWQDNAEMVLELLKHGANVNAGKGEALIAACESCDEDLVEILLEHGADPNVRSGDGKTAIQMAKQNADPLSDADGIIALLKEYGAKQ